MYHVLHRPISRWSCSCKRYCLSPILFHGWRTTHTHTQANENWNRREWRATLKWNEERKGLWNDRILALYKITRHSFPTWIFNTRQMGLLTSYNTQTHGCWMFFWNRFSPLLSLSLSPSEFIISHERRWLYAHHCDFINSYTKSLAKTLYVLLVQTLRKR